MTPPNRDLPNRDLPNRDREGAALTHATSTHQEKPLPHGRGSVNSVSGEPVALAYLITFRSYGTWLHGDERGSVDRNHNVPGSPLLEPNPARRRAALGQLKNSSPCFDATCRAAIADAICGVCTHRDWHLHALAVRSNHVHCVVSATARPEAVMNSFKSWATRHLNAKTEIAPGVKVWERHGSTRYLWNKDQLHAACRYVMEGQGEELPT